MLPAQLTDVGIFGSIPRYGDLSVHAAIDLRRSFTRAELERAAEAVIAAFPVFGCRYAPSFFRDRWVKVSGPVSDIVHVVDEPSDHEAETRRWAQEKLVPTRDRPFRLVSMRKEGGGSRLILSLMHLATDGGGMAAIGQVIGAALLGRPPSIPTDARRSLESALDRLRFYHVPFLLRDMAKMMIQPLRVLAAGKRERPYPKDAAAGPSVSHLVIERAELDAIKARFGAQRVSVNDLLVSALAKASARRSSRGDVVVLYTMDLRRYSSSPRLSAANNSSILTALVPRHAVGDLASTAAAVAAITAQQRESLVGPAFVLVPVALTGLTPHGLVRRLVPGIHPLAVDAPVDRGLVVTNVGRIDEGLGSFADDIEDIRIIGPNMEGIPVPAVVAFGFRGRLHLELYAAAGLAPEALDELEAELCEALEIAPRAR
jgi:NRPS condensation-like uncharacterized protein